MLPNKGVKSPQKTVLWAWIGVFKPNSKNIKTFILSQVLKRFKPNLAQRWRQPSSLRGWSYYAPGKSKMAAILKKTLNRHMSATVWPILMKFGTVIQIDPLHIELLKIRDGGGCHLENHRNRDISATATAIVNLVRWCKMGLSSASNPLALNGSGQHQPQVELR